MKCSWKEDTLMCTSSANSSTFIGCEKLLAQPGDGLCNSVHTGFGETHLSDANPDRAAQQPDQNLIDHQRGEELRIAGMRRGIPSTELQR